MFRATAPTLRCVLATVLMLAAAAFVLCVTSGCRVVNVQKADGTSLFYGNFGFDTQIGELEVQTPEGAHASLKNANSQTQAFTAGMDAARALLRAPAPAAPTNVNIQAAPAPPPPTGAAQ